MGVFVVLQNRSFIRDSNQNSRGQGKCNLELARHCLGLEGSKCVFGNLKRHIYGTYEN